MPADPPDPPDDDPGEDPRDEEERALEACEEADAGSARGDEPEAASPEESEAAVRALVSLPDTRRRVRAVVARVSRGGVPEAALDEVADRAIARAVDKARTLRSPARAWGWLSTIAGNEAKQWIRRDAAERRALRDPAVRGRVAGAVPAEAPAWSLVDWLRSRVKPRERPTLDLLLASGKTGKTVAELAAERGDTANAAYKKVGYLKKKYAAQLEADRAAGREPRRRSLAWVIVVILGGLALAAALFRLALPAARPAPPPPVLRPPPPAPSLVLPAPPPVFEPAEPGPSAAPRGPEKPTGR